MSLGPDAEAIRKSQIEGLKFRKQKSSPESTSSATAPSAPSSASPGQASMNAPPAQSRDATVPSRYFPSTPVPYGRVLVPSSSPLNPDSTYRPYSPYNHSTSHDVAGIPGLVHTNVSNGAFGHDPLSAPSGFASNQGVPHASYPRQLGDNGRRVSDIQSVDGDEPPRKRMRGASSEGSSAMNFAGSSTTPGSAAMGRSTQNSPIGIPATLDETPDIQNLFDGPSNPRIVRARTDSHASSTSVPNSDDDKKFMRFKLTTPEHGPDVVRRAWTEAKGDTQRATALLHDRNWLQSPKKTPTEIGRVKERDEALRAERAATKEMGKNSLIYANRPTVRTDTPPKLKPSVLDSPSTPLSPVIQRPRVKRSRAAVIDSDSESEPEQTHRLARRPKFVSDAEEFHQPVARRPKVQTDEGRVLDYFNTKGPEGLQELTGCTPEQATKIIELRPFHNADDLNTKLGQGRKKAGPGGISPRIIEDAITIFEGYGLVDGILADCEGIGASLRDAIAAWTSGDTKGKGKQMDGILSSGSSSRASPAIGQVADGALSLVSLSTAKAAKNFIASQPSLLSEGTKLKDYQLLGVNWLNLLYQRKLSCILADEMGLGKTIQVISFFAHLKEKGSRGPHLVVVPASTLENWLREFQKFAPGISVTAYYAGKEERPRLRQDLLSSQASTSRNGDGWEVLVTTYALAQGDERDRKFFKRVNWDTCVYDEGHSLKNYESQRYKALVQYGSNWRLLLTGTPLQNNLQELVSLMNFIHPKQFAEAMESLRFIFKVKGDSKVSMLAQERVSRAKKMMTPFVLRRRKDQVAKDLPNKTERIEWCEMSDLQRTIYNDALQRSRKTVLDAESGAATPTEPTQNGDKPVKKKPRNTKERQYLENSSNVLMDLRKASSHPMLFRRRYNDQTLAKVAKVLMKEPDFKKRGAVLELVIEDMEVMTDAELQIFFAEYKATRKYLEDDNCYLDSGKVAVLLRMLDEYIKAGRKVLVFSQFVQVLDILKVVLKQKDINYLMLTGNTPVDVRQSLVDQFTTEGMELPVFLLSTKAGGMGINLVSASVVILFDQDFNPHNDKQAQDRAYRIGQKRDVDVIKLITRGTIEEDMLKLAQTKLALDDAVAGDTEESDAKGDSAPVREMKASLMNVIRKQLEEQIAVDEPNAEVVMVDGEVK